jgi:hypothetical protein
VGGEGLGVARNRPSLLSCLSVHEVWRRCHIMSWRRGLKGAEKVLECGMGVSEGRERDRRDTEFRMFM